jgi:hypothetical protein
MRGLILILLFANCCSSKTTNRSCENKNAKQATCKPDLLFNNNENWVSKLFFGTWYCEEDISQIWIIQMDSLFIKTASEFEKHKYKVSQYSIIGVDTIRCDKGEYILSFYDENESDLSFVVSNITNNSMVLNLIGTNQYLKLIKTNDR